MLVAQGHSVTDSYTHIFLPLCHFWLISSQVIAEIPFLLSIWSFTFVLLYLIPFALLHFLRSYSSSFSSHILPLAVLHPRYNTVLVFSSRLRFSQDSPFATGKKKRGTRSNTRGIVPLSFFHPCETPTSPLLLRSFKAMPRWPAAPNTWLLLERAGLSQGPCYIPSLSLRASTEWGLSAPAKLPMFLWGKTSPCPVWLHREMKGRTQGKEIPWYLTTQTWI